MHLYILHLMTCAEFWIFQSRQTLKPPSSPRLWPSSRWVMYIHDYTGSLDFSAKVRLHCIALIDLHLLVNPSSPTPSWSSSHDTGGWWQRRSWGRSSWDLWGQTPAAPRRWKGWKVRGHSSYTLKSIHLLWLPTCVSFLWSCPHHYPKIGNRSWFPPGGSINASPELT